MIRRTFRILPGVGPTTERRIRAYGVADWDDFLTRGGVPFASAERNCAWCEELRRWRCALAEADETFFYHALPTRDHWRLYDAFRQDAAFLDIETTGMGGGQDEVTVVGIYRPNRGLVQLVAGLNLSGAAVEEVLRGVKLLVTFYGSAFDLPFLSQQFPWLKFRVPHFDLCFAGKAVGLSGGLKKVEQIVGVSRPEYIRGLNGYDAVKLWRAYREGYGRALDLLRAYNAADTINLAAVADFVYNKLAEQELNASPAPGPG